jgi:hypothetical protein
MALMAIPIVKSKGAINVDTDKLPEDVYAEALLQGLKVILNRGTSKITKALYPKEEELKAAANAMASKQLELCMKSEITFSGKAKAKKVTGAVMTEARRLAKLAVKAAMKEQGIKVSHVAAKDITAAANALIEADETFVKRAEENLKAREGEDQPIKIDVAALVKVDPKKVAAAEAKKAKAKPAEGGQASAAQAGRVQARAKGKAAQATA